MKKVLKLLGLVFIILVLLIIAIPYFFKDKVIKAVEEEANKHIDAKLSFDDVNISLIKNFPNASIGIQNLKVEGKGAFDGVNLYAAENTSFAVDIMSLIRKGDIYRIKSIVLDKPEINVLVLEDGTANYDIASSEAETAESSSPLNLALEKYNINKGTIQYHDKTSHVYSKIEQLNHQGKGNFKDEVFDLFTETDIEQLTVKMEGVPYLNKASLQSKLNMNVNSKSETLTLQENNIKLNGLNLNCTGTTQYGGSEPLVDLSFKAEDNAVGEILSLIPGIYLESVNGLSAQGNSSLSGEIKGKIAEGLIPGVKLQANITNGNISFPDLPQPIKNLNLDLFVNSSKPDGSDMVLDLSKFGFDSDGQKMNGKVKITEAMSAPNIEAILNGDIQLGLLNNLVDFESIEKMGGLLKMNIELDADYADIESSRYENIQFNGKMSGKNMSFEMEDQPKVVVNDIELIANPKRINIPRTSIKAGKSDLDLTGEITEPLAFILNDRKSNIDISLKSNLLDANEWIASDSNEEETSREGSMEEPSFLRNVNLNYTSTINKLVYDEYQISNIDSRGTLNAEHISLDRHKMTWDGMNIQADGLLTNAVDYLMKNEMLKGKVNIQVDKLDMNNFASEDASEPTKDEGVIELPKNINLEFLAKIGELIYDDINIKNADTKISLKDERADLVYFKGQGLGGSLNIKGAYDTKDIKEPKFDFSYDLKKIDFQSAYKASNSLQKLAPIIKFLSGSFNSNMALNGVFDSKMSPVLEGVNIDGFLQTLQANLEGFAPIKVLQEKLGIPNLSNIQIKDSKNWFTVKDGAIHLKENSFTRDGMNFKFGGKHFINQTMDYLVKAEIPRDKLGKNVVSNSVDTGISWIEKQAQKGGVAIDLGDYVYFDIKLSGSFNDPKIKIIPTGSGGKSLKETAKDKALEELDDLKKKAKEKAEEEFEKKKEEVVEKAGQKVDEAKEKIKEEANKKVDEVVNKGKKVVKEEAEKIIKEEVADKIGEKTKEKVDEVLDDKSKEALDKLKDINPFKKKKKKEGG